MKQQRYSKNNLKVVNAAKKTSKDSNRSINEDTTKNEKKSISLKDRFPKITLLLKVSIILLITFFAVKHTEEKDYYKAKGNFHDTFLQESLIKASKDTIDLCLFGNSHIGHAINAHQLSNSLGCLSFIYFENGSDLQDVYYSMIDVLSQSKIKNVVIETYCMTNAKKKEQDRKGGKHKIGQYTKWTYPTRIKSTFDVLTIEQIPQAWSNTLRNHDFIFRDTAQINNNIKKVGYQAPKNLYLGSSANNEPGISDSTEALFVELGPTNNGEEVGYDEYDLEYIEKIRELCEANDIKIAFLTIPEYYKNIKNYDKWREVTETLIKPFNAPWLDFQKDYDSTILKKECFENVRSENQHVVSIAIPYLTNRLASFIKDSCKWELPDRTNSTRWHDIFYGTDGYFYNYAPRANDTVNINICGNKTIGKYRINNVFYSKFEKSNNFVVKFEKDNFPIDKKSLKVIIKGIYKKNEIQTVAELQKLSDYVPFKYHVYWMGFIKDFEPKEIVAIEGQN